MPTRRNILVTIVILTQKSELVSTGKISIELRETHKKPKFTPPCPIKSTPTGFASNGKDMCLMSFSNDGDISMTSSSQNKEIHVNHSTHLPEGKTTEVVAVAVIRATPKDGCHSHPSNKNYKRK
jgi:hypothetical protein